MKKPINFKDAMPLDINCAAEVNAAILKECAACGISVYHDDALNFVEQTSNLEDSVLKEFCVC